MDVPITSSVASILFPPDQPRPSLQREPPRFFTDLLPRGWRGV